MRVLFIGSTKFGLGCLELVNKFKGIKVVGVVTGKKEFKISYSQHKVKNVLYSDFKPLCNKNKIPFYILKQNMKEKSLQRFISKARPDFVLVVGWYHLIPKGLLNKYMFAGLHASLLPKYRGGSPLVWALINGEKETGITFFVLGEGVDSGPVIGQRKVKIEKGDNIRSLYEKIERLGLGLLEEFLPEIANNTVKLIPQDESRASYFPQRKPEDGLIEWSWSPEKIKNFIRAQTKPYPGAYTITNNKKIIIWDADITST